MAEEAELIEISGRISSVIYTNEENGWTVLRLDTLDGGLTHRCRHAAAAYPGEELRAYGEWATHPNHGRQFKAEYAERSLPRTAEDIYSYLAGHAVKGVGPATAALIVEKFGDKALDVIEREPAKADGDTRHLAAQGRADRRRFPAAVRPAAADGAALLPRPAAAAGRAAL